jgi:hypothetical protein
VLQLGSCSYPNVSFSYDATKTSAADVIIRGNGRGLTMLGDVNMRGAKHLTLRDLSLRDSFLTPQNGSSGGQRTEDVTFDNVDMYAGGIFTRSCKDCTFRNGASGNRHDAYSQTIGTYAGLPPSENITIDSWRFHDMDRSQAPGGHMECLFVQESNGVLIRNSLFERCSIMDVFFSPVVSNNVPTNITMVGNTFRRPSPERGGGAVLVNPDPGSSIVNYTFDANTWDDRLLIENDGNATLTNVVWCRNNTGTAPATMQQSSGRIVKDC